MDRLLGALLAGLNTFASLWVVLLVAIISLDVIGRTAFNFPLPGVPEVTRLSLVAVFWLQMAHTLRIGGHLRTTTLLDRFGERGRRTVIVGNALIGCVLLGAIAYWGYFDAVRAWETDEFEGEEPVRVPTWPLWWALTVGAALTALQYMIFAYRGARYGTIDGDDGTLAQHIE
jgi:TRAP-type C4-dicarboxylate transport system permease small subunit